MLRYQRDRKNFAKRDNVRFNLNEHNKRIIRNGIYRQKDYSNFTLFAL